MKTISVAVSKADYEAFQRAAKEQNRSTAQLIREAMALYRAERLVQRTQLRELPVLAGHRPKGPVPTRVEVYDELFGSHGRS